MKLIHKNFVTESYCLQTLQQDNSILYNAVKKTVVKLNNLYFNNEILEDFYPENPVVILAYREKNGKRNCMGKVELKLYTFKNNNGEHSAVGIIKSLLVLDRAQHRGIGSALIKHAISVLQQQPSCDIAALATNIEPKIKQRHSELWKTLQYYGITATDTNELTRHSTKILQDIDKSIIINAVNELNKSKNPNFFYNCGFTLISGEGLQIPREKTDSNSVLCVYPITPQPKRQELAIKSLFSNTSPNQLQIKYLQPDIITLPPEVLENTPKEEKKK